MSSRSQTRPDEAAAVDPAATEAALARVAARYAVAITPAMAGLIDPADPADPIARQFLPDPRELATAPGETADPIGDHPHSPVPGVVHRYPDRVLLKLIHACPVYCRFCFRREMVGPDGDGVLAGPALAVALDYVRARPEIWEVILTGGDPFMLSARRAGAVTAALAAIDHVRVARWHTRVPIVDPDRVTPDFVAALRAPDLATYVAVHCNHPRELTAAARAALARLADAGIPLLAQTVLLAGVNADAVTLEALFRALVEARVKPYYLHHPDLAPGTAHHRLDLAAGRDIVGALRGRLSGIAQPTYVLDIPGGHGKAPVGPEACVLDADGACRVRDPAGRWHAYPPT